MHNIRHITEDIIWVGASDRRIALFENAYPVPDGVSYNSYIIKSSQTALLDACDASVCDQFMENVLAALDGQKLDYIIVNHMEPDHSSTLACMIHHHPEAKIVATAKAFTMMKNFFGFEPGDRAITVKEGDTLEVGTHKLSFMTAPMVHWPEVMVTFDSATGTLFSADAFGTFGAIEGAMFNDDIDFAKWVGEYRRYYTNIVGKYGPSVQTLLKKAANLTIKTICPLHGPVWRSNIPALIEKYDKWSRYEPEDDTILAVYSSMYGHTKNAAEMLASELGKLGAKVAVYDASAVHPSYLVSEAFHCKALALLAVSYNNGVHPSMEIFLNELAAHNFNSRKTVVIENGSWAPSAGRTMKEKLSAMKNMEIVAEATVTSAVNECSRQAIINAAQALAAAVR